MKASSLDTTQIIANAPSTTPVFCPNPPYPTGQCATAGDKVTLCSNVLLNIASQSLPVCGTLVTFQYPFQFYLPYTSLNLSQIKLTAQAQSRMEN